jgi:hypothetical protein
MSLNLLFPIILASGAALAILSKRSEGTAKILLIIISVIMIGIGGYGLFTAMF